MFRPRLSRILTCRIERRNPGPGRPDDFIRRSGRRPYLEVVGVEVPPSEDEAACFKVEKRPGKALRTIRQVDRPSRL